MRQVTSKSWRVYAKRPFAGPSQVLAYLGRYTHRVAITPQRLRRLDRVAGTVTFTWKDYADGQKRKEMTLSVVEFVRRFALHILPARLAKIRHFGLLAIATSDNGSLKPRLVCPKPQPNASLTWSRSRRPPPQRPRDPRPWPVLIAERVNCDWWRWCGHGALQSLRCSILPETHDRQLEFWLRHWCGTDLAADAVLG